MYALLPLFIRYKTQVAPTSTPSVWPALQERLLYPIHSLVICVLLGIMLMGPLDAGNVLLDHTQTLKAFPFAKHVMLVPTPTMYLVPAS